MDKSLNRPGVQALISQYSRVFVQQLLDDFLGELRTGVKEGTLAAEELDSKVANLELHLRETLERRLSPRLRKVVNATGVIIYTNAGRAPLAREMIDRMTEIASHYTNLEYDLEAGSRGHRDVHVEERITRILRCEAATICNNAAAAVLLILNTLASGKKVMISRGELVEIGGSFRIPEILEKSGAILSEVGTTNKTRAADYDSNYDEDTALILRVHPSNYRILGFTHRPSLKELAEVSKKRDIPLIHDIGSGYLFPTDHLFLQNESTVESSLSSGSDLVCFSGDKLLGGPQAGLIVGRESLVDRVRKNPLMRAFRVDKLTYAALDWTLLQYEQGTFQDTLPIWQRISEHADSVRKRTFRVIDELKETSYETQLLSGFSLTGGGSAPEEQIPTWLLAVSSPNYGPNQIEAFLRSCSPAVLCRIEKDQVLFDLRTVFPGQEQELVRALLRLESEG